jgi:hypothetical protein
LEPERRILPEGPETWVGTTRASRKLSPISLILGNVAAATTLIEHYEVRNAGIHIIVIPAKAGIHWLLTVAKWIPAFAGMTVGLLSSSFPRKRESIHGRPVLCKFLLVHPWLIAKA